MGWKLVLCALTAGVALAGASVTADARTEQKPRVAKPKSITHITVTRRSSLDGGPEYIPGHPRPYNEYLYPPNFVPSTNYDIANQQVPLLYPMPNLYWLP